MVARLAALVFGLFMVVAVLAPLGGCASFDARTDGWSSRHDAEAPPLPAREYRAAWVASVANIDWPSEPGLSVEELRREIDAIVKVASDLKFNALFVQVRPSCDALYRSELEPWSEFLTGVQGALASGSADTERFDPLAEWISAGRAAGIEIHAWVNPFRARHAAARSPIASSHIAARRPDLVRIFDTMLWLDPGEPDAQTHTLSVIDDLVRRYDLAGVHVDDYFYPYPKPDQPFPDDAPFARYQASGGTLAKADWRRDNINRFVQRLYTQTKAAKPHVRVSISPFGIWRPNHPQGVRGFDAYEGLSADVRLWLREGWCDAMIPQLYWKIDAKHQPYVELLNWWQSENPKQRLIVAGNYATRINDKPESWTPDEIASQIVRTRDAGADGNVLFSMIGLMQNRKGLTDVLRGGAHAKPALTPETPWLANSASPRAPRLESVENASNVIAVRLSTDLPALNVNRVVLNVQRAGGRWETLLLPPEARDVSVERTTDRGLARRVSIAIVDHFGRLSSPSVMELPSTPNEPSSADSTTHRR
jgi:uncharacterized lipoprotein YddW (UPF0748 family)